MEKPTLTGELHQVVGQTGIAILRAQARGYEEIVDILFRHGLMGLNGYTFHEQSDTDTDTDTDLPLSPKESSFTEAPPAPEVATTAPEEPSAAPPIPEEPPAPMPAEDPGATPRRRGRPRKVIAEESPSLLPAPKPPTEAEPVEANEPSEPAATPEPTAAGDDDLPW